MSDSSRSEANGAEEFTYGFVSEWEFACCGEPHRVGDQVSVTPWRHDADGPQGDLRTDDPWARLVGGRIDWSAGHHDVDDATQPESSATILAIWEAWAPAVAMPGGGFTVDPEHGRLVRTGRTSPHAGCPDAVLSPRPPGIPKDETHWGWVLQLHLDEHASEH